jgi:prephenate dehydratase
VFQEVEAGHADFGVVPVENSGQGTIQSTLDMFLTSPLKICGEVELRVHQYLLSRTGRIEDIERVYSHPLSLAQCRGWLRAAPAEGREDRAGEQRRSRAPRAQRRRRRRDRRRDRRARLRL